MDILLLSHHGGTLNAIDLNKGEILWQVPLGEFIELTKKGIPKTGTENYGGPVTTAGGLIFIAASKDEHIRAFDKDSGEELWKHKLPAGGYATPRPEALQEGIILLQQKIKGEDIKAKWNEEQIEPV